MSMKRQATLRQPGLMYDVEQKVGYLGWAWTNLRCQSRGRLVWVGLTIHGVN